MNRPTPTTVRRRFFAAIGHAIHVTWPVLSIILAVQVALGLLIASSRAGPSVTRSILLSSPGSRLVTAISYRGRRSRAHLR